jgi:hypothetical protein
MCQVRIDPRITSTCIRPLHFRRVEARPVLSIRPDIATFFRSGVPNTGGTLRAATQLVSWGLIKSDD